MPLNVDVEIRNLDAIKKAIDLYPERARKIFSNALYDCAKTLANAVRNSQKTPVDTGTMVNKTGARKVSDFASMTYVATSYAVVVHEGIASDVQLRNPVNVFLPGVGWRRITRIKARAARPFVDWALQDGAQARIDAIMSKALATVFSDKPI